MNKCNNCGKPAVRSLCEPCKVKNRAKYHQRKIDGICVSCGRRKANPGKVQCISCSDKNGNPKALRRQKLKYDRRKEDGLCVACGVPNDSGKVICWPCTVGHRLYKIDVLPEEAIKIRDVAKTHNGVCRICRDQSDDYSEWYIDHCHRSRRFRGFVCNLCNMMLGAARDRIDVLHEAIAYLKEAQSNAA